jgi:hypothetical protein
VSARDRGKPRAERGRRARKRASQMETGKSRESARLRATRVAELDPAPLLACVDAPSDAAGPPLSPAIPIARRKRTGAR